MDDSDPTHSGWMNDLRVSRQETNTAEVYGLSLSPTGGPLPGWGGLRVRSEDNQDGARELEFEVRPVLHGLVELRVRLSTEPPGAARPHSKSACLYATPTRLRELAEQLMETADAADALRLRPRPIR